MLGTVRINSSALVLFAAAAMGCSAEAPSAGDTGETRRASPADLALELSAPEPALARRIARSRIGADGRSRPGRADDLIAELPASAGGSVELRVGERARPLLDVRLIDAQPAPRELDRGSALYRGALSGSDVLWSADANGLEQLIILRDESSHVGFAWEICARLDLGGPRRDARGGLTFADARGEGRIHMPAPYALDALGARRAIAFRAEPSRGACGSIAFELDARGLTPPVLIDPALEVVTWHKKQFATTDAQPPARFDHGLAYDPVRGVSVLFGGRVFADSAPPFGDTWEWNGASWKKITPALSPSPRTKFGMTYSVAHGGVVLHGGLVGSSAASAVSSAETWKWDGTAWSTLPAGPPALNGHSLAYDSARSVVVLYGGRTDTAHNLAVWELGATGWQGPKQPPTAPGTLIDFPMVYDPLSKTSVLHGGMISELFLGLSDETWAWDGQTWSQLSIPGPSARYDAAVAFDSKRGRSVFVAGGTPIGDTNETWELSQSSWELRQPLASPFPMSASAAAYDAKRDRVVLFGGWTSNEAGETFEYFHFGNACSAAADCDGFACLDSVCCSSSSCDSCGACSPVSGKCEPVVSSDDPDSCTGSQTCNADGVCAKKNGGACSAGSECASGHCADGVCCNSSCAGSCEACGLSGSVGTCTLVTGSPVHGSCPGTGPCGASCDGTSSECTFTPEGSDCGSTCSGVELTRRSCDGAGSCATAAPAACPNRYACASDTACRTSCSQADECAPGFVCVDQGCTDGKNLCIDESTSQDPSGKQTDCGAYRCLAGACRTNCGSAADCSPGAVCTADGRCQGNPSSPSAGEGGCGCRAGGRGQPRSTAGWLLLLLLASRRRKRG